MLNKFFCISADGFKNLSCFVILLAPVTLLTYYENPVRNPLQRPSNGYFNHGNEYRMSPVIRRNHQKQIENLEKHQR
jgi:hypothetical protein